MSILPLKSLSRIRKAYRESYGLPVRELDASGRMDDSQDAIGNMPMLAIGRANALREAVRWGEPYLYFALPNIINWIIPVLKDGNTFCGLSGGMVLPGDNPDDRISAVNLLLEADCSRSSAENWYDALPIWKEQREMQKAADFLFALTRCELDWDMSLLENNRKMAYRQRKIAEEVHRRKRSGKGEDIIDEERTFLALVQAGDKRGARGELNRMLGALFSHTADIRLIKAHIIEMMGHLVRGAVENNPSMSSLIEKNHSWMGAIIDADGFEQLSNLIFDALEDYLDNVYLQSRSGTNETVAKVLSYVNDHYDETVSLEQVAAHVGLSSFRVAHLVKDITGNTIQQHVRRMRIQRSVEMLTETDKSCTEIAYSVGFCDQSYFIKQFKRQMGITPARYRRMHQHR